MDKIKLKVTVTDAEWDEIEKIMEDMKPQLDKLFSYARNDLDKAFIASGIDDFVWVWYDIKDFPWHDPSVWES